MDRDRRDVVLAQLFPAYVLRDLRTLAWFDRIERQRRGTH